MDDKTMRRETLVGPLTSLVDRLVSDVREEAARATARPGLFAMALPGGSVGTYAFPALAALPFEWKATHVFWVDERAVPPSSADSNFRLADSLWLRASGARPSHVHRMPADQPDLSAAADAYSAEIIRELGPEPRFNVVLLGVGPDGHVASLFPGHSALSEKRKLVLPIVDSPKPPPHRLTLTLPLLTSADRVIVMALGESKAAVMHEALTRDESVLPVSLILQHSARSLVLLDDEAGSRRLERSESLRGSQVSSIRSRRLRPPGGRTKDAATTSTGSLACCDLLCHSRTRY